MQGKNERPSAAGRSRATPAPPVLFLHGGPGMTAELERRWLGASLPIHWWDQPRVTHECADPLGRLVDAATREIDRLSDRDNRPVALLASSFGAHLAIALLGRMPERIGPVTISGGVLDLRTAFVRLGRRLAGKRRDADLERAAGLAAASTQADTFWALFDGIISREDFLSEYWSPRALEQGAVLSALAAEGALFDVETFRSVVNAVLAFPPRPVDTDSGRRIRVLLGRHDAFVEEGDSAAWHAVLPTASVEFVDAGRFPHLELPADEWMPAQQALR